MNNITIGGVTIYTTRVETIISNELLAFTPPTTTQKQDAGRKDTILVDLFRIEERYVIDGELESGDYAAFKTLMTTKGTKAFVYRGSTFQVSIEKMAITEEPEDKDAATNSPEHFGVKFTVIVGEAFGQN